MPEVPDKTAVFLIKAFLLYLLFANVAAFALFGVDKWKARHRRWRIPEHTLLGLALVGGSLGAWLGMCVFHHKTLHKKFRFGVPFILIVQAFLLVCLFGGNR